MRIGALAVVALMALPAEARDLLLFAGENHGEFIGCLTCSEYDSASICNEYGAGSEYKSESIFNEYGRYGSEYALSSPWNEYSSSDEVPVVVDGDGNFYGYFTINAYRRDAADFAEDLARLYKIATGDLVVVRNLMCSDR